MKAIRQERSWKGPVTVSMVLTVLASTLAALIVQAAPAHAAVFNVGDVFVGSRIFPVGLPGGVVHLNSDGIGIQGFPTGAKATNVHGLCFDSVGNLYATNHEAGSMTKFYGDGGVAKFPWGGPFGSQPTGCVVDSADNVFTGEDGGASRLRKWDSNGNLLASWSTVDSSGIQGIDLAADQCTLFYTTMGPSVRRFDVCTGTQLSDFVSTSNTSGPCFSVRIRANGEVFVTCAFLVYRLSSSGAVIQTYPSIPGCAHTELALNIDGTSFWVTGSPNCGSQLRKIDINTGTVLRTATGAGAITVLTAPVVDPLNSAIGGTVVDVDTQTPLASALVELCGLPKGGCTLTTTDANGRYLRTGLGGGNYLARVFPPSGARYSPFVGVIPGVGFGETRAINPQLRPPESSTNVTVAPSRGTDPPRVASSEALTITASIECEAERVTWKVQQNDITLVDSNGVPYEGEMIRSSSSRPYLYTATIRPLRGHRGYATILVHAECTDREPYTIPKGLYIDPSGVVRDTSTGLGLPGATVTLFRSDISAGPFNQVPDGDAIMSPANRKNPDATDADGRFGWDVLAGFYKVQVTRAGCHAPGNPSQLFVETAVLEIPPPVTDLDLGLECPVAPQITTEPSDQTVDAGGMATFRAAATGTPTPTVQWQIQDSGGSSFSDIPGATSETLTLSGVTASQNGSRYQAVFTNSVGSATTNAAVLTVMSVPPPSAALVTSFTPSRLRQDFSGWVGMQLRVGSSDLSVTAVGRWVVEGNGADHTVKIVDAASSSDVPGAAATVATAGAAGDAFAFADLGSPVTLLANKDYYLVSEETAGGDAWYDWDTRTVTTSVAHDTGVVYAAAGGWVTAGGANAAYGPPNLRYATASSPPLVATQPSDQTVAAGTSATFTAAASGVPAPTVRWQVRGSGESDFSDIPGASSPTLTVDGVAFSQSGNHYRAVFTNSLGTATTNSALLSVTTPPAGTSFVTSFIPSRLRQDFSGWVGMRLTVGSTNLSVTALGRWVAAGNAADHTVKLVDASTGADVAGGSATVATAGRPSDGFAYGNLPNPVSLLANKDYYLVSEEMAGGDAWYDYDTRTVTTTAAADNGVVYAAAGTSDWVGGGSPNQAYGPPNFLYTVPAEPEPPSGGTPYVSSFTPTRLRQDFSGWVGMKIVVGPADVEVSAVGRWVVPGNSRSHTVKFVDAASGLDAPGGSAAVATANAVAQTFQYADLPSAVNLLANRTYYLVSEELAGGDTWYDYDTNIVTSTAAASAGVAYSFVGSPTSWVTGGSAGHAFGPVSFLYRPGPPV